MLEPVNPAEGRTVVGLPRRIMTLLAELPGKAVLTQQALAEILGVTTRTIRRMVARFELPPGVKVGRDLTWFAGDILAWWEKRAATKRQAVAGFAARVWNSEA